VNITRAILVLVIKALQDKAGEFVDMTDENATLHDAADALADALDLLDDLGEL
jgi:hypothetical protein